MNGIIQRGVDAKPALRSSAAWRRLAEVAWSGASAVVLVLAVLLGQRLLDKNSFHSLALLITVASFVAPIAAMGIDQAIYRAASAECSKLPTTTFVGIGLFSCATAYVVSTQFSSFEFSLVVSCITLLQFVSTLLAAIDRARGRFFESTFWAGTWRISMAAGVFATTTFLDVTATQAVGLISLGAAFICVYVYTRRARGLKALSFSQLWMSSIAFLFGAVVISGLSVFDRTLIALIAPEYFSRYIVFATVFIFPFSFLAAALVPILAISIKGGRPRREVIFEISVWLVICSAGYLVMWLSYELAHGHLGLPELPGMYVMLVMLALVLVRISYSLISALFSTVSTPATIWRNNLLTLTLCGVAALLVSKAGSVLAALIAVLLVWLARICHGYFSTRGDMA